MIFKPTRLDGAFLIMPEKLEDRRGFFTRTFCRDEFSSRGLDPRIVQCSVSSNRKKNTLRGMHYQLPPKAEVKLVRCTRGSMFDVILDLRPSSGTYCKWASFELTADNCRLLYIPEGLAHGFLTLEDGTDVLYQMSEQFAPGLARGVRWNDPAFGIAWPTSRPTLSKKDREYKDFHP